MCLGKIPLHRWCQVVEKVTGLNVPWRALADRLVKLTDDGRNVLYKQKMTTIALGKDTGAGTVGVGVVWRLSAPR